MPRNGKHKEDADLAQQIEQAVDEALARGDHDEASRLAAGHPSPARHVAMMERIHAMREGGADPERESDQPTDLAGSQEEAEPPPDPMVMFELAHAAATLVSFNARTEHHGDAQVPAADVKLRANIAATKLDAFDPALRSFFFCKRGNGGDLADQTHDAPNLRIQQLKHLTWNGTYPGYRMAVHLGISGEPAVDVSGCTFDKIRFEPKEGGTVVMEWTMRLHHDQTIGGVLSMLVGSTVDITLRPPEEYDRTPDMVLGRGE